MQGYLVSTGAAPARCTCCTQWQLLAAGATPKKYILDYLLAGIFTYCNVLAALFFEEEEKEEEISTPSDRDVVKVEGKDPAIPGSRGNMFV